MSLPRKDARIFLDDAEHARLKWVAARNGLTVTDHVEKLIQADNSKQIDQVVDAYHELVRAGLVGKTPEPHGTSRKNNK